MPNESADFLVVGAGVMGLALALELKTRYPDQRVTLIEKEEAIGLHASGRNSGVVHAGFYYTADSLKARFTREGNRRLTLYCDERKLPINRCGKLVVARNEDDLPGLDELLRRGAANQVEVHEVTPAEARELEPLARTHERALWSPTTSSVDPRSVLEALLRDARDKGIEVRTSTAYLSRRGRDVLTTGGTIPTGFLVNTAGLYADRIARDYGFSQHYRILPFKGLYLYGDDSFPLRRHVYPVPNLANPFLGVHFTVTADAHVKIGPTAIPAFWREHYDGLSRFRMTEFGEIVGRELGLFVRNDFNFRTLALTEMRKYDRRRLVGLAGELAPGVSHGSFRRWGKPGIRAQLLDTRTNKLEMDFRYEGDATSLHVLNAVSPAFTCALPMAEHLANEIGRLAA